LIKNAEERLEKLTKEYASASMDSAMKSLLPIRKIPMQAVSLILSLKPEVWRRCACKCCKTLSDKTSGRKGWESHTHKQQA